MIKWNTQEEYEALFGTQEAQAAKQCRTKLEIDGPWRLVRDIVTATGRFNVPLDNSVRSTSREIALLRDREFERTGIVWSVVKYS